MEFDIEIEDRLNIINKRIEVLEDRMEIAYKTSNLIVELLESIVIGVKGKEGMFTHSGLFIDEDKKE